MRDHGDSLARYARLLFADGGAAEDALQTALYRLARHWHRHLDAPTGYTKAILRNLAHDGARRSHLVPVPTGETLPAAQEPDLLDAFASAELLDMVLRSLPPKQRLTVILRVIDGLSEAETAAILQCAPGTVKSNLARGLARLRECLDTRQATERTF